METPGRGRGPVGGSQIASMTSNQEATKESKAEWLSSGRGCRKLKSRKLWVRLPLPIPTAEVELEGDRDEALLDTSSPVTIVPLGYLLQLLAKKRAKGKSPDEWKRMVTSGNEWWRDDWSPLC